MTSPITPAAREQAVDALFAAARIIPVITITDLDEALPLARRLVAEGMSVLEITLRSDVAIEAIARIAAEVPEAIVGAGTVLTPAQLDAVTRAGARFAIAPGATPAVYNMGDAASIPLLPGVATASELMLGLERGYTRFKLFPAVPAGGVGLLKAFAGPFAQARFCPTGGITEATAKDFLQLPNVMGVGGSWMLGASKS